jgi:hypothetical protein
MNKLDQALANELAQDLADFDSGKITKERLIQLFQYLVDTGLAYAELHPENSNTSLRKTAELLILLGHITNTWNDWSKHQTLYSGSCYTERKKALSLFPTCELC